MTTQPEAGNWSRLRWCKSTHSRSGGGDCVEVALTVEAGHVRGSKDTARPGLSVSRAGWGAFPAHARG